jgi:hypothetical protein
MLAVEVPSQEWHFDNLLQKGRKCAGLLSSNLTPKQLIT